MAQLIQSKIQLQPPSNPVNKKRKVGDECKESTKMEPPTLSTIFGQPQAQPQWQILASGLEKQLKSISMSEDERYECCSALHNLCSLVRDELSQKTTLIQTLEEEIQTKTVENENDSEDGPRRRKRRKASQQGKSSKSSQSSKSPKGDTKSSASDDSDVAMVDLSSEKVCELVNVQFKAPRGRFHIEVYKTHLRLRPQNKINKKDVVCPETIIPLQSVVHIIRVPILGQTDTALVFNLKKAIPYGKQSLQNVMMLFKQKDNIDLPDLSLSGHSPDVVLEILSSKIGLKASVLKTDNAIFQSSDQKPAIRCFHGINDGLLYPLKKGILFITKPLIFAAKKHIAEMKFARSGSTMTKSVDLDIEVQDEVVHSFTMIKKDEQETLGRYVVAAKMGERDRDSDATDSEGEDKSDDESDPEDSDYDVEAPEEQRLDEGDLDMDEEFDSAADNEAMEEGEEGSEESDEDSDEEGDNKGDD